MEALVSPKARIGRNVRLGRGVSVGDGVEIGDDSTVGDFSILGEGGEALGPLVIGAGAVIRSHSVIYSGSSFGPGLQTAHHVVIRDGTRAGVNLRVGNFCDVEGKCQIGDYVRMHGYAHVGRGSTIGDFCWLYSLTTLTNDPLPPSHLHRPVTLGDGTVLCVGVTAMPGTVTGKGVFVAADSQVKGNVPAGALVHGGEIRGTVRHVMDLESGTRHPWFGHFKDAYPPEAHARIDALRTEVMAAIKSAGAKQ